MLNFLLIFLLIGRNLCFMHAKPNYQIQNRRSAADLPLKEDLDKFFAPIENFTNYIAYTISKTDLNCALGLFFTNVQLGRVVLDRGKNLPTEILSRIEAVVKRNEEVLHYFHVIAKKDSTFMSRDHVIISQLFTNSTYWINRLKEFKYEAQPGYLRKDLEKKYSKWQTYVENVENVYDYIPSPENSDICLVTLAINPKAQGNSTSWCPVANICYKMLTGGTNFSYALCHRLGLLIFGQLGQGCSILSVKQDEELKQKFCTMAYAEAEYIAMNSYGNIDLILEIICLCAMDGRVEFLRRTWLHKMFYIQHTTGCFAFNRITSESSRRTGMPDCNSHTTSVASGTYAAAVRYILEKFY